MFVLITSLSNRQEHSVDEIVNDVTAALLLHRKHLDAAAADPDKHKMLMEQVHKVSLQLSI